MEAGSKYANGIDNGEILGTKRFSINSEDTAKSLHYKNTIALSDLLIENYINIKKDKYKLIKQKEILATYYPKRSPEDSLINWNDSMDNILKLIKASTTPFNLSLVKSEDLNAPPPSIASRQPSASLSESK